MWLLSQQSHDQPNRKWRIWAAGGTVAELVDALLQTDSLLVQLSLFSFQLGDLGLQASDLLLQLLRLAADAPLSSERTKRPPSGSKLDVSFVWIYLAKWRTNKLQPPLDDVLVLLLYEPHPLQNVGDVINPPLLLHRQTVCSLQTQTDGQKVISDATEERFWGGALRLEEWAAGFTDSQRRWGKRLFSYREEREEADEWTRAASALKKRGKLGKRHAGREDPEANVNFHQILRWVNILKKIYNFKKFSSCQFYKNDSNFVEN